MISLTPFSDCIQDVESDEYLTILYSTPEDANKARILAEWERMLGEIQALLEERELHVMVCSINVMEDTIPEALVRTPFKSFMTLEYRREHLPEILFLSRKTKEANPEILGVYGIQASPPKESSVMLDFLHSVAKVSNRDVLKQIIKDELRKKHDSEIQMMANKWDM